MTISSRHSQSCPSRARFGHCGIIQQTDIKSLLFATALLLGGLTHGADSDLRTGDPQEPLQTRLATALAAQGPNYRPRTEHLNPDGSPRYINRLILEDSPYLLQHAHNPVHWYPWGAEAFAKARRENKPVFLSIGYSTCHWCHVMERESFENLAIAELLNRHFVAIKVDREVRPDLDQTYMKAVELISGRGGWPMSSVLTPAGETIIAGTYFPPDQFADLLARVQVAWNEQPDALREQARSIADAVAQRLSSRRQAAALDDGLVEQAVASLVANHDDLQGGFGGAPKFPHEPQLALLLDQAERAGDEEALAAALFTLRAMARGGIHDQVGGGFHRYSIDNAWLVPHFEKMLYNQAQLARVYTTATRLTADPELARTARRTLDFLLRDLTSPEGGFYSATDADSEGGEGRFFLWTPAQLLAALPGADAQLVIELFGVTETGNFEDRNILHLPDDPAEFAASHRLTSAQLWARIDAITETLRTQREVRPHPHRDDKVLTAWNGMAITALAEAGMTLGDDRYIAAATRAADAIWTQMRPAPGELLRNGSLTSYSEKRVRRIAFMRYLNDSAKLRSEHCAFESQIG